MVDKRLKILVIGSGGREHALVWKLSKSDKITKIYCAPGNAGTEEFAENIAINPSNIRELLNFAKVNSIDLTFVGPEGPLIAGIVDKFKKKSLNIVGPSKKAARIEGTKVFAKKLMAKYAIPTAKFKIFTDYKKAKKYLKSQIFPQVLKADGQCLGKGVLVAKNFNQAEKFLDVLMIKKIFAQAGSKVIIEECLTGQELSFMVVTDGKNFISLLPSQDHKRIFDNDHGPNTGGMGAFAPVPLVGSSLIKKIEKEIVKPTLSALEKEGCRYSGILYPGLILTKQGPKVLEFNCRFGDPETQPVLSLLKTDLIDILLAIQKRQIHKLKLSWNKGYAVCVVLASKGYPANYQKGFPIFITGTKNVTVFHSGTNKIGNKFITSGGRVLGVTGIGSSLFQAIKNTYKAVGAKGVHFKGMYFRRDIGAKGLNKNLW